MSRLPSSFRAAREAPRAHQALYFACLMTLVQSLALHFQHRPNYPAIGDDALIALLAVFLLCFIGGYLSLGPAGVFGLHRPTIWQEYAFWTTTLVAIDLKDWSPAHLGRQLFLWLVAAAAVTALLRLGERRPPRRRDAA